VKRWQLLMESPVCHERSYASCGARPALCHLLIMTAYKTVNGASRGHGLNPVLGERPHDGGGATACAVLA